MMTLKQVLVRFTSSDRNCDWRSHGYPASVWWHTNMRMLAADAANRRRHFSDRLFKSLRQMQHLSSPAIEGGSQLSPERAMFFLPEIEGENTIPPTKELRRSHFRSIPARRVRQSVERNRQLACPHGAQDLHAYQALRKEDRMTAIHGNRVEQLQPGQWIAIRRDEGAGPAHVGDRAAGLHAAKHIPFGQVLVFQ
jgi:hypothetical protein